MSERRCSRCNFLLKAEVALKLSIGLIVFVVCLFVMPGVAQTVSDGDTLKVGLQRYRLFGIDAPESQQTCSDGWPAGRLAASHLQSLIVGRSVTCQAKDRDRYGRLLLH